MNGSTILWIVVAAVVVIVAIIVIVAVSRKAAAKKREAQRQEAAQIRQNVAESSPRTEAYEAEAGTARSRADQAYA
ncbi:hypothetical protein DN550_31505, partial [Burkholderia multivorans]